MAVAEETLLEQSLPYLISGSLALLGVWAGKVWERRGGHRAWLREQRLSAFARLIEATWAAWSAMETMWEQPFRSAARAEPLLAFRGQLTQIGRVVAEIHLLGPQDVVTAADGYSEAYDSALELLTDEVNWDAIKATGRRIDEVFDDLITAEETFIKRASAVIA